MTSTLSANARRILKDEGNEIMSIEYISMVEVGCLCLQTDCTSVLVPQMSPLLCTSA